MSKKILVYRYENKEGNGPYNKFTGCDPILMKALDRHDYDSDKYPKIWGDINNNGKGTFHRKRNHACCLSIKDLRTWFKGINKRLYEDGYVVCVYEVNKRSIKHSFSGKQAAFSKRKAVLHKVLTYKELLRG